MKRAFLFPGQGSQFVGMCKDLYNSSLHAKELMDQACRILGFNITEVMFEGTEDDLKATRVTQPAVFLHSVVLAECSPLPSPDMVGGHSLGEFSALVAAAAVSFEDGLRLVEARAQAMQECCEKHPGAMAAIIGLDAGEIERICSETPGVVVPANYNSPGQTVISGEKSAVDQACASLKEAGAKRALPLAVSGAFHSPLMEPAREKLAKAIESTVFAAPRCPIYQNVTARPETDPAVIKANLLLQLTSPVRWTQTMLGMLEQGACEFTEIGPGTVLQGLLSRMTKGMEGIIIQGIQ